LVNITPKGLHVPSLPLAHSYPNEISKDFLQKGIFREKDFEKIGFEKDIKFF
jgi:hypothetical protein